MPFEQPIVGAGLSNWLYRTIKERQEARYAEPPPAKKKASRTYGPAPYTPRGADLGFGKPVYGPPAPTTGRRASRGRRGGRVEQPLPPSPEPQPAQPIYMPLLLQGREGRRERAQRTRPSLARQWGRETERRIAALPAKKRQKFQTGGEFLVQRGRELANIKPLEKLIPPAKAPDVFEPLARDNPALEVLRPEKEVVNSLLQAVVRVGAGQAPPGLLGIATEVAKTEPFLNKPLYGLANNVRAGAAPAIDAGKIAMASLQVATEMITSHALTGAELVARPMRESFYSPQLRSYMRDQFGFDPVTDPYTARMVDPQETPQRAFEASYQRYLSSYNELERAGIETALMVLAPHLPVRMGPDNLDAVTRRAILDFTEYDNLPTPSLVQSVKDAAWNVIDRYGLILKKNTLARTEREVDRIQMALRAEMDPAIRNGYADVDTVLGLIDKLAQRRQEIVLPRGLDEAARLARRLNLENTEAVQAARQWSIPLDVEHFYGEVVDAVRTQKFLDAGLLRLGADGTIVQPAPDLLEKLGTLPKAIESWAYLTSPRYIIRNMANNYFTGAATWGLSPFFDLDSARMLAADFPVPMSWQGEVMGKKAAMTDFADYVMPGGKIREWLDSVPLYGAYTKRIRETARSGRIAGEETARIRFGAQALKKIWGDLWGGTPSGWLHGNYDMLPPLPTLSNGAPLPPELARDLESILRGGRSWQRTQELVARRLEAPLPSVRQALGRAPRLSETEIDLLNEALHQSFRDAATPEEGMAQFRNAIEHYKNELRGVDSQMQLYDDAPVEPTDFELDARRLHEQVGGVIDHSQPDEMKMAAGFVDSYSQEMERFLNWIAGEEGVSTPNLHRSFGKAWLDIQRHWTDSLMSADDIRRRYRAAIAGIDSALPPAEKKAEASRLWREYFAERSAHWQERRHGLAGVIDEAIQYVKDVGSNARQPIDYQDGEEFLQTAVRQMAQAEDIEFEQGVLENRVTTMTARLNAWQEVAQAVTETGDNKPLAWFVATNQEEARLAKKAVAHIDNLRPLARQDPEGWRRLATKLWHDLAIDTENIYRELRNAIAFGPGQPSYSAVDATQAAEEASKAMRQRGFISPPDMAARARVSTIEKEIEITSRPYKLRKLASEAGIATGTEKGVPADQRLINVLNQAFRLEGEPLLESKGNAERILAAMSENQYKIAEDELLKRAASKKYGIPYRRGQKVFEDIQATVDDAMPQIFEPAREVVTRDILHRALLDDFGYTAEQADAALAIIDARSKVWARQTGNEAAAYIERHFAGVGKAADNAVTQGRVVGKPSFVGKRAAVHFLDDGRAVLLALREPDASSVVHELAHVFRKDLEQVARSNEIAAADLRTVTHWEGGDVEKFPKAFELYLSEGKAPNDSLRRTFARFQEWLAAIYGNVRDALGVQMNADVRSVFDRLLADEEKQTRLPYQAPARTAEKAPKAARGLIGKRVTAWSDPARKYEFDLEVVNLEDLVPSNTPDGAVNPDFLRELQPRDRRAAASLSQVHANAQRHDPEEVLGFLHSIDRGPPVVGPDNMVEAGNGRVMTLQILADEHPDSFARYKQALLQKASDLGIDAEKIAVREHPVLVRRRVTDVNRLAFVKESNASVPMRMTISEAAAADAELVTLADLNLLDMGAARNSASVLQATRNREFTRRIFAKMDKNEVARYIDGTGRLNRQGLEALRSALFFKAFGDNHYLIDNYIMASDEMLANVGNGIDAALVNLARLRTAIAEGKVMPAYDIAGEIDQALREMAKVRYGKTPFKSIAERLANRTLFDSLSEETRALLLALDQNIRSGKRIGEILNGYAERALREGAISQGELPLGLPPKPRKSKLALIEEAIIGPTEQKTLFQSVPDAHPPRMGDASRVATTEKMQDIDRVLNWVEEQIKSGAFQEESGLSASDIQHIKVEIEKTIPKALADAKLVASISAQHITDSTLLNYADTRLADKLLSVGFPYHYWYTRTAWNWAQRLIRRPGWILAYARYKRTVSEMRQKDPGLRRRFWDKIKVASGLTDKMWNALGVEGFANELYLTDPIELLIPFDFMNPDFEYNDPKSQDSLLLKAYLAARAFGFTPHIYFDYFLRHAVGEPPPKPKDMLPILGVVSGASALAQPLAPNIIPPGGFMFGPQWGQWDAYRLNRTLASMAADEMHLEGVDYSDPVAVLQASLKVGKTPSDALLKYVEVQRQVEKWLNGELSAEEVAALKENPVYIEAARRSGVERAIAVLSSYATAVGTTPIQLGEKLQVELQKAERAVGYGGSFAGVLGRREFIQAIRDANPWGKARWAQYGAIEGGDRTAENVYWMVFEDAGREKILNHFGPLIDELIKNDPANYAALRKLRDERAKAFDELAAAIPKDEQNPRLWSTVGAGPEEALQIRATQIEYEINRGTNKPSVDDFTSADEAGKETIDWNGYFAARDKWEAGLYDNARQNEIISAALDAFDGLPAQQAVLMQLTHPLALAKFARRYHDPLEALAETVHDLYVAPSRAYFEDMKSRFGDDVFERKDKYNAEIYGMFGSDIYDVQNQYFSIKGEQGKAAARAFLDQHPSLRSYWDWSHSGQKDALRRKYKLEDYYKLRDQVSAKYPPFEGGKATDFIDAVLKTYPEHFGEPGWTDADLQKLYAGVADIPDAEGIKAINMAEELGISVDEALAEIRDNAYSPAQKASQSVFYSAGYSRYYRRHYRRYRRRYHRYYRRSYRHYYRRHRRRSRRHYSRSRRYYSRRGSSYNPQVPEYRPKLPGYIPSAAGKRRRVYLNTG